MALKLSELFIKISTRGVKQVEGSFKRLNNRVKEFGTVTKLALVAAGIAVTRFTTKIIDMSFQFKAATISFQKLGDPSLLQDFKRSTRGMVSELDLLASANKALLLGLEKDQLADLFRDAAIVAKAAGRSTTEAIDDITIGIGRQSRMILDNLGIIVKAETAYENFAKSIGKTSEQLTENERKTAFASAAIQSLSEKARQLGDDVADLENPLEKLGASFDNLKVRLGILVSFLTPVIDLLAGSAEGFTILIDKVRGVNDALEKDNFTPMKDNLASLNEELFSTVKLSSDMGIKTKENQKAYDDFMKVQMNRIELNKAENDEERELILAKQQLAEVEEIGLKKQIEFNLSTEERIALEKVLRDEIISRTDAMNKLGEATQNYLNVLIKLRQVDAEAFDSALGRRGGQLRFERDRSFLSAQRDARQAIIDRGYQASRRRRGF